MFEGSGPSLGGIIKTVATYDGKRKNNRGGRGCCMIKIKVFMILSTSGVHRKRL